MDPTIKIEERVSVVVIFRKNTQMRDIAMPYKMRWGDKDITFTELGLRHPTKQGSRTIHVFDVSDGVNGYRLEFDAQRLTWTLQSMLPGDKV